MATIVTIPSTQNIGDSLPDINGNYGNLNSDKVDNNPTGEPTGSDAVLKMVSLTQAEYNAGTPVATTFYIITDAV